jgi:hypothetical protein
MRKLWILALAVVAAGAGWLAVASVPDIKRYMRMHEM